MAAPLCGLLAALALGGCALLPTPRATSDAPAYPGSQPTGPLAAAAPAAGASQPAVARPPTAPPTAGTPPPFAEITRGATRHDGFVAVWTRDERSWLEIPAERLDRPFFLGSSNASGLAEGMLFPGLMGREHVVELRRVGNVVQLVALNLLVRAPEHTPLARAVAESYSDSLLAAATLAAAPHPERKSLLVDAQALFGGDLRGLQTQLERSFRLPYALDRANSSLERWRTDPLATTLTMRSHFALSRLPAPPSGPANPATLPRPPASLPDARSLFMSQTYTLAPLPSTPMKPRRADPRVGYFSDGYLDLGDDTRGNRRTYLINRWRLEKQDPAAALSPPKQPLRVVMDRNIPPRWRDAVRAGILEWNRGFERAGLRDALVVEQQADDADWRTFEGTRLLAVRWFALEGPGAVAVGPSQSDPRTGEILRGAAIIPENWVRLFRTRQADERLPLAPALGDTLRATHAHADGVHDDDDALCSYAADAAQQAAFGLDLLAARGELDADGPQADLFIEAALKDVVMHEVGHALGLRHNFRASTGITASQLRDAAFVARHGVSNSVMDYNGLNLSLAGEAPAPYFMGTLGAYDTWAIEYGYREWPEADEAAGLQALAARAERDPALAYATDEDLGYADPGVLQRDLSNDPMAFAGRQLALARELWTRTERRTLPPGDDYGVYRRNLLRGLMQVSSAVPMLVKYVGGTATTRALAGSGKALVTPVPAPRQRAALDLLLREVFSGTSFRVDPALMSRLGVDASEPGAGSPDFSLAGAVLTIQGPALDSLMGDATAARLADAETKVADTRTLLSYAELQARLRGAVWSELSAAGGARGEIDSLRRNLQREHLRRLAAGVLRPTSAVAADVRAVHRQQARELEAALRQALAARSWSASARAHLADSQAALAEALRAPLLRQGV